MRGILKRLGIAAVLLFVSAAALSVGLGLWFDRMIVAGIREAPAREAALVLGTGRMSDDGSVSPVFEARMVTAAALIAANKVHVLIISGYRVGTGRASGNYDEPADMRDALRALGVPDDRIVADDQAYRTLDSIVRAQCVFGQRRLLIVSQRDQLERALFLAWAHRIQAMGVPAANPSIFGIGESVKEGLARLLALADVVTGRHSSCAGPKIRLD